MGSKKTKTTTQQTTAPTVPTWIQQPQQQLSSKISGLLTDGGWSGANTPATAQQTQAWSYGGTPMNADSSISGDLTGYRATAIDPALMNFNPGEIATSNLSAYTNPYETSVVNSSLADNERARQMAIQSGQARATAAGAFGGSRHGVADSLTNEDYLRNAGSLASQLRMAGYNNAQSMAQQDIGNRLSGAQFRLGAQGQQEGQNLNAANMRLSAQNALFGNQLSGANNARADASLMASLGEQQRQLNARENPNSMESLQALAALMQYNPNMYVGQNMSGTSTSKTSGGALGGVLGAAGSLFGGLGALGWKPLGS